VVGPKTGDEQFKAGTVALGFCVQDFWRWSASDLVTAPALMNILTNTARFGSPTNTYVRDQVRIALRQLDPQRELAG
jgi:hypothetical protein